MDDTDPTLQEFLTQWQEEIKTEERVPKREAVNLAGTSALEQVESPAKRHKDPPPILVLPPGQSKQNEVKLSQKALPEVKGKSCLVDLLIADLDEINTIPFFDIQLPKEIAMVIFGFLDVKDLCNCAMVSKSWRVLAEDGLLWYRLFLRAVSKPSFPSKGPIHWKSVVQDLVLQKRQVERNWKERICGLSEYQPDNCGVLCCVSYFEGTVLSCYSSGAVCVWDLSSDLEPAKVKQIPGPHLTSEPICCDIQSTWGVLGTSDGCLKIIDTETCSQVYCLADLGAVDSVSISCTQGHLAVGVASHDLFNVLRPYVSVLVADGENSWERTQLPLGDINSQLTRVKMLSCDHCPCCLLYSTSTSLTLHPLHSPPTHILTVLGEQGGVTCVSCFEVDREMTTVACGTSAFGYQVQLFDLPSGASRSSLKGHGQQVTSLSLFPSSGAPHMLVSGSADRRVRVFDCRSYTPFPVITLRGHGGTVHCVQMDRWKVTSGSSDGMMIVWDQRMAGELWRTHERHSADYCSFDSRYLVCGHIPLNKHPIRNVGRENPNICHRRFRGLVRVMDFSVDPLYYTRKLPSVCASNYDEPGASFFNLDLKLPYDSIS